MSRRAAGQLRAPSPICNVMTDKRAGRVESWWGWQGTTSSRGCTKT